MMGEFAQYCSQLIATIRGSKAYLVRLRRHRCIPLHKAAGCESPAFCKILVDACPKSVVTQRRQLGGGLPIHRACFMGRLDTVKFLYEQYPESIFTHAERSGYLPIHKAVQGHLGRDQIEIVKFLLTVDQDAAKREVEALDSTRSRDHGQLALHLLCHLDRSLDVAKVLFDAYPNAVYVKGRNDKTPLTIEPSKSGIARYLKGQMKIVSKLRKSPEPDEQGRSTVHRALMQGASLGAIKLLVQEDPSSLGVVDDTGSTPLHYACGRGMVDKIQYLLSTNHAHLVGVRDGGGKLPIQLLVECGEVDHESAGFVGAVWRLLREFPETVSGI